MFQRITKKQAKKLFATKKETFFICPRKLLPHNPFNPALLTSGRYWFEKAEGYVDHPDLWKGSLEETAWDLMYNQWLYYNASYETGYYAHYYVNNN